jgi:hypothetical protein
MACEGRTLAASASSSPACSACAARAETSGSSTRTRSCALAAAAPTANTSASRFEHSSSLAATCVDPGGYVSIDFIIQIPLTFKGHDVSFVVKLTRLMDHLIPATTHWNLTLLAILTTNVRHPVAFGSGQTMFCHATGKQSARIAQCTMFGEFLTCVSR